jgi:predicted nuclease of restriction endonuclease-like RecB superfamily
MRINLPVTNTEYPIEESTLILSTTDTKERITYVNQTFIEISGFYSGSVVKYKLTKLESAKTSILLIIPSTEFLSFERIRM